MRLPGIAPDRLESDEWYTPPYIFTALQMHFDLDPCSPSGGLPWLPAKRHFTLEDDGLAQLWDPRWLVWLNPPYSDPLPWVRKMADHGNGIALLPLDPTTSWAQIVFDTADTICLLRDRVTFVKLDNDNKTSARFPSLLAGWGFGASAVAACDLGWSYLEPYT